MNSNPTYDVIIAGGGLAGLSLAIQLARRQYRVLLIEKESYPKHKVCGEYISMESYAFLEHLGLPLSAMGLPLINRLIVTDTRGNELCTALPQGGFGISRYQLDACLAGLATAAGATLLTKTRVEHIHWADDGFRVETGSQHYLARVVCGTWGRRSKIDIKTRRPFTIEKKKSLNNFIGVKYHIRYPWPTDMIGLHNFTDGYCGISQIEDNRCCLCYLTTAAALKKCGNDIKKLELKVLSKNPSLRKIFSEAEFIFDTPMTISQISFEEKEQLLDHVLLLGDAAGVITPLCGNGMSMALHASKLASGEIDGFLQHRIDRETMEDNYVAAWKDNFSHRTFIGRMVQANFGRDRATAFFIKAMKVLPLVRNAIITGTSGKPF